VQVCGEGLVIVLNVNNRDSQEKEKVSLEQRVVSLIGNFMKNYKLNPEEEEELYGTSTRVIGIFMILVTVFFPVGIINVFSGPVLVPTFIYSGLWMIRGLPDLWILFNPFSLLGLIWLTIPLCGFNFLFIRQVNRFFQGETSRDIVLMFGLLSVLLPSVITITLWVSYGLQFIITPIPIQFFIGLLLLYKFREPEVISPWKGFYLDWSWWTRLRHSVKDPEPEVINLTKLLSEHDADWLESYEE
jgi:hypothetical protein